MDVIWTTSGSHWDHIWKASGLYMEVVGTTSGDHVDYIRNSFRLHLEGIWITFGHYSAMILHDFFDSVGFCKKMDADLSVPFGMVPPIRPWHPFHLRPTKIYCFTPLDRPGGMRVALQIRRPCRMVKAGMSDPQPKSDIADLKSADLRPPLKSPRSAPAHSAGTTSGDYVN